MASILTFLSRTGRPAAPAARGPRAAGWQSPPRSEGGSCCEHPWVRQVRTPPVEPGPWPPMGPRKPVRARIALVSWVSCRTRKSRGRCRIRIACCAPVFIGTKRMFGRAALRAFFTFIRSTGANDRVPRQGPKLRRWPLHHRRLTRPASAATVLLTVGLASLDIRLDVGRRDQPNFMAELYQLPCPEMGPGVARGYSNRHHRCSDLWRNDGDPPCRSSKVAAGKRTKRKLRALYCRRTTTVPSVSTA